MRLLGNSCTGERCKKLTDLARLYNKVVNETLVVLGAEVTTGKFLSCYLYIHTNIYIYIYTWTMQMSNIG